MEMKLLGDEVPWGIGWRRLLREGIMARKNRLTRVAVGIGQAIGRADRKAHQVAKAGGVAKKELEAIGKQVDALKKQLQKTTKRLKAALR
jgi:seryl-tRNA synthetase